LGSTYKTMLLCRVFMGCNVLITDALKMLLNSAIDIFNNINYDKLAMDNLVESSIKYAIKFGVYSKSDFNRVHRKRQTSCILI